MKKLLLFAFTLNLCLFMEGQAQSQTPSRKRPKFSPHSRRAQFTKPPHFSLEEIEDDSSLHDERLHNLVPPHLQGMKNLPPHILAERQWHLPSEAGNAPAGTAGLEPNHPFDRLYPPHKRPWAQMLNPLKSVGSHYSAQSFQSGATQTLLGAVQESWVARYEGLGSSSEIAQAMATDAAGNIYVTGYSLSIDGSLDYLTIKYNAAGVLQWTAKYNGPANGDDRAVALAVDGSGNVYVTGDNWNGTSYNDYATIKYNSTGTQEWVATYNGPRNGQDHAVALDVDSRGNVYVTGYSNDEVGSYDYATVKYNAAGTQEWAVTYHGGADRAVALAIDGVGNVYVTGYSYSSNTAFDYATVKYNVKGTQVWVAIYSRPGNEYAVDLVVDASGNVYVAGYSWNDTSYYDYATVKYNSAGQEQWVARSNSPGNRSDQATALAVDGIGNVYVTGYSTKDVDGRYSDYTTVKYNSAGSQEWVATYNGTGDDYARALAVDGTGNVYVTGSSWDSGRINANYATVKYNAVGKQEWVAIYNGPERKHDSSVALTLDGSGNVYVTGYSDGSGTISDYATIKYNAFGVEQWIARHDEPGPAHDIVTAMVIDGSGNSYVAGYSYSYDVYAPSSAVTIKYDAAGVQQWVVHAPCVFVALAVDGAGNVYVTGTRSGDYATVKYNPSGIQEWVSAYNGTGKYDVPAAIALDGASNVYVTGSSSRYEYDDDYEGDYNDYATVKYNTAGQEQWVARGNWGELMDDRAVALAVDDNGNVYVTGYSADPTGEDESDRAPDYITVKYNSAGQEQWVARYDGPEYLADGASASVVVDGHGKVYVTAKSVGGYATIKYNSTGTQEWVANYNASDNFYDRPVLAVNDAGNVYVTGFSGTVKYNFAGIQEWVANGGNALAIDGAGNVYVTELSWNGTSHDAYITVKYSAAGAKQWVATYNGPGNRGDNAIALAVDDIGSVYVAGYSAGSGTGYDFATIKYTQIIADAGPDKKICAGSSVPIGGSPTGSCSNGGPYAFSWAPTTGLNDPTAANPIASPATTTTYTVTVMETATGLSATDTVTVTVPTTGWSVAHIVDVDDVIFGIDQGATTKPTPRDNRGLALSPDERFLYLGYSMSFNQRVVRKIDLSVSDPANNHSAVVAQLKLPPGSQPARDIATDDKGRVYLALGTKIEVYNSNLQAPPLHTISGFTACEGLAVRREINGALAVYATDRLDKTLERFVLVEGAGETITSSVKRGLDGDGEVLIVGASRPRGLDLVGDGTAWIADLGKNRVYRVNSAGKTVDSTGVRSPMDVAIDESRGEVYVSQYTLRTIKVLSLSTGKIKRTLTPPAADLNVDLEGETGSGALCGIDVASCKRVYVANEQGRSLLTGNPLDSPFSNVGDNNDVKAADTDPVLLVTGSGLAKEPEVDESEVASEQSTVTSYQLEQNYPNPFNPSTKISFALPEDAEVSLKIYDIAGQLVQTLVNGNVEAGRHQVVWDGTNQHGMSVASGVYFYQLQAGEFKQVRKMSLVR